MRRRTDALFYTLLFCISCSEFKRPLTKPNQDLINWNQFVSVNICTHSVNYLKLLDGQQVTHDIGLLFYLAVNYLYSKDKFFYLNILSISGALLFKETDIVWN